MLLQPEEQSPGQHLGGGRSPAQGEKPEPPGRGGAEGGYCQRPQGRVPTAL